VLAVLYSITGYSFVASRLLMIVLGSLVPLVVFALTDSIFKRKAAIIAGVIAAVYPSFILYSNRVMPEALLVLLVCLMVIFMVRFARGGKALDVCAAGLITGLACLCRPTALAFIPVGIIWILIVGRADARRSLRAAALLVVFAAIVIAPWTYRNYSVHGEFVPVSTRGGMSLWLGNNDRATGNLGVDNEMLQSTMPDPGTDKETEMDRFYRNEAMKFIKSHPKRFILLGIKKVFHFWRPEGFRFPGLIDKTPKIVRFAVGFFSYVPVFLLFLVGCLRSLKQLRLFRDPALLLLALLVVVYTLPHGVYPTIPRYRQAIEPVIIAVGSWGLVGMLDFVRKRSRN
jgi:4-amino-4-deoxy-L-arabinose transferase-like glycosyltransferase